MLNKFNYLIGGCYLTLKGLNAVSVAHLSMKNVIFERIYNLLFIKNLKIRVVFCIIEYNLIRILIFYKF